MKYFILSILLITLSACIGAGDLSGMTQRGENRFPTMEGIDLMGDERVIPDSFAGDLNIVAVAFEREQQADVNTWIAEMDALMGAYEDLRFYEIPVIYEVSAPYRFWINNGMRSGIPSDAARERTITVYTEREPFLETMDMSVDQITVLLLDDSGQIVWRADGALTDEALEGLKKQLDEHAKKM